MTIFRTILVALLCVPYSFNDPLPAQPAKEDAPKKRVALVIGVNKYDKRGLDDLSYAEHDAEELAATLSDKKTYQFDKVILMKGGSKDALRASREN